jgi:hypothetical protein
VLKRDGAEKGDSSEISDGVGAGVGAMSTRRLNMMTAQRIVATRIRFFFGKASHSC